MQLKSVVLVFLYLCIAKISYAQSDYRPGFVIGLKGDTTTGFLLYKEGASRFEYCSFKVSETTKPVEYNALQISGYGFTNDRHYESKKIKEDEVTQDFFAEVLVKGRMSLLMVNSRFYLEDSESKIYLLQIKTSEVINDYRRFIATNEQFKGILTWKFNDCPKASKQIKSAELEEQSLTKLFELYNSCFNEVQYSFKSSKPWSEIYLGVSGGLAISSLSDLEGTPFYNIINEEQFRKDKSLFAGISMTFRSPRISERFSLNLEVLFQESSYESLLEENNSYDAVYFEYTSIQVPISFAYIFNLAKLKIKPTLEVGLIGNWVVDNSSFWQHEYTQSNTVTSERVYDIIAVRGAYLAPFVGFGVTKDFHPKLKVFLKAKYFYGFQSAVDSGLTTSMQKGMMFSTGALFNLR